MRFLATICCLFGCVAALASQTFTVTTAAPQGFSVAPGFSVTVAGPVGRPGWSKSLLAPNAEAYAPTKWTQRIVVLDGRDDIRRVPVADLEERWHQSGGMLGLTGWKSTKYRSLPAGKRVRTWVGNIAVKNQFGHYQNNRGIKREYPDGTRFDDVLANDKGEVFEHRTREKIDGAWHSDVIYSNPDARPKGYAGLGVRCGSCHGEAGTGEYGMGLVPGGDGNLSDPLDWSVIETPAPESSRGALVVPSPPRVHSSTRRVTGQGAVCTT